MKHPSTLTSREIEALYARPNNKQNQIGLPVNNTLDRNKQNFEKQDIIGTQNKESKSPNISQNKSNAESSEEDRKISNQSTVPAIKVTPESKNESISDDTQFSQDNSSKEEQRKQGETHLLQLRKGVASNKPIFTSIFGNPASNQSNRYVMNLS